MTYTKKVSEILPLMRNSENIRNVGILAHVDHGKTTLSDNLLARCGLLSPSLAGQARALDYLEEEQKRGITMKTANISLPYEFKDQFFIVNLIDTPGHVDFSGARDQSLRVIDGAIIVVDAVEGCMVQTEIVTKQALEEYIKPLLFINKIDRLFLELRLSLKEIEKRLNDIIENFNDFIELYALDSFEKKWRVDVKKGNIGFGSALHLWGCTAEEMLQKNTNFGEILNFYKNTHSKDSYTQIQKLFPLGDSIFKMIINQVPNPRQAQIYRIPRLWNGDTSSKIGQDLLKCDSNGGALLYIYKNISDKNLGIISIGRVYSGKLQIGQELFSLSSSEYNRIQQLFLFMGAHREPIKALPAGNIVAFNIHHPKIGDTLVERNYEDSIPFEKIKYESEAVVQYSIEPLHPRDLKQMMTLLEILSINDPNLVITVNEETGEILISGLGELHLEVISNELKKQGIEIITSEPIVTYRESIRERSEPTTVESTDSQNSIIIQVEPLKESIVNLLTAGELNFQMSKNHRMNILQKNTDWNKQLIENLIYADNLGNVILLNPDKYNFDFKDEVLLLFNHKLEKIFRFGPIIRDPIRGLKVKIQKISLKSEISQFNLLNLIPLLKQGISEVLLSSNSILLQPIYDIQIKTLQSYIGVVSSIIAQRNGRTSQVEQKGSNIFISGQIPVKGTFGLANTLRSKASGHVFWQTFFSHWEPIMPESLMNETIQEIRIKRGLTK